MTRLWSPFVAGLKPYVPGEQPRVDKLVKLNTNENPYPPSPRVIEAINASADDRLRLYPDPESLALKAAIATNFDVSVGNVFVGNGSDEILAHAFNAFFRHDKPVLFPDITYSFYPVYCKLYGIEFQQVPLAEDFSVDIKSYQVDNGGIVIANPNAPTGMLLGEDAIVALLKANPDSLVLIDEAYVDFGGQTAAGLCQHYDNLLVVQTLSKSRSLAGMRVGYAIGNETLIDGLQRVKNSFNSYPLDRLAEVAAVASFADDSYFVDVCDAVIANRAALVANLEARGFSCLPSAANFIMASHTNYAAVQLHRELRARNILVRYFDAPRIDNYLRISIGLEQQHEQLLQALDEILA